MWFCNDSTECMCVAESMYISTLHEKAELLVGMGDDGTQAVLCNLDHVEELFGSRKHSHMERICNDRAQLGSATRVFLLPFSP